MAYNIRNLKPNPNSHYKQGYFDKFNPKKYVGDRPIIYRSGYELTFMRKMELNPNVLEWSIESHVIPYLMDVKVNGVWIKKRHNYNVDAYVKTKDGIKYLCEIKPLSQSPVSMSQVQNSTVMQKNFQKWKYALQWCKNNGYIFRVINENHLKTKIF